MKKIAIIGSGQAGLLAAHGLLQKGNKVTLYSDKTADDWLNKARPTGTAARFGIALDYERELGLNHWEHKAPEGKGVHLTFSPKDDNTLVTLAGKLTDSKVLAIDLRLQSHRWLKDFQEKGGKLIIEKVSVERLEEIQQENDITLVGAGKGSLSNVFQRNEELSSYKTAQRKLSMMIVKGNAFEFEGVPYLPIKFNFLAKYGEAFWIPFYHKDHGATWCLLFEAKEGGKMDQFDDCQTGEELIEKAKKVIKELMPHDYDWCKNMELADQFGWIKGSVTPAVRQPAGILPSGNLVMPIGDSAISMDPIGGQGANLGNKYVRHTVEAIAAHNGAFDKEWMENNFNTFWNDHGKATVKFNNALLEPLTGAGKLLMISQYGSTGDALNDNQKIANAIFDNFRDPRSLGNAFLEEKDAKDVIARVTGKDWKKVFFPNLLKVAKGQFKQAIGLSPNHPLSSNTFAFKS